MKKVGIFLIISALCGIAPLSSEIVDVTLRWRSQLCQTHCLGQLQGLLQRIPGAGEVSIVPGQAVISWRPNYPFNLYTLKTTVMVVGLYIYDMRVKVKGKIQHDATHVYLISQGDGTRFTLLNPVIPDPARQAPQYTRSARGLTPDLRAKFLDAESQDLIATISGPIFMPERSPPDPLSLEADHISFDQPKEENTR